jgi:excisionase family DNA binding protein
MDHATTAELSSPWMTAPQTAAYLQVALGTLRNWTSAKYIPHVKRGGIVRYHRDAIDQWLARDKCPGRTTFAN